LGVSGLVYHCAWSVTVCGWAGGCMVVGGLAIAPLSHCTGEATLNSHHTLNLLK
jgi:hypothetical protein